MLNFANADVLINEFLPNSVNTDYEWIEIYNNGAVDVNLSQFNISEEKATKNFTIRNFTISADGFIVLVRNKKIFSQVHNPNGASILEYGEEVPSLNLNDGSDSIFLYNSSGNLVDFIKDYPNPGENISIGRYLDGEPAVSKLKAQTPGAKNDNSAPTLNKWIYPHQNNSYLSGFVNVLVNITDDTSLVGSAIINFNDFNYSMSRNGDLWSFLLDTSLNIPKSYNMTIFFNDSYGMSNRDTIFNMMLNSTDTNQKNNLPSIIALELINEDYLKRKNGTLYSSLMYDDLDGDAIIENETLWYIDNIENASFRNLSAIASISLRKNQIWKLSMRISDGKNWSGFFNSSALTIEDSAPTQSSPIIASDDEKNRKNGTLTCDNQNTNDLDNDIVTNFINWYKNNELIASAVNSSILKSGNYSKNDNIICESTPNDGQLNGTPLNSTDFKISNTAPSLFKPIQIKIWNQGESAQISLINHFIDLDGDEITYTYSTVANITVSIDNNAKTANLMPDSSFNGTRYIEFFASDGFSSANSNNVSLIVKPLSLIEKSKGKSEGGFTDNGIYDEEIKSNGKNDSNNIVSVTGKSVDIPKYGKNYFWAYIALFLFILIPCAYFLVKKLRYKKNF